MGKKHKKRNVEVESEDKEVLTISKTAVWQAVAGIFAVLFVASLFTGGFGLTGRVVETGSDPQAAPSPTPTPSPSPSGQVSLDGARAIGNEDASIIMVEYSSFTCPFCARHSLGDGISVPVKALIEENFVDKGDVLYVYKHFTRNDMDVVLANAAECAGEQGAFWEYKNLIYQNLQSLGQAEQLIPQWAQELGLDTNKFNECFNSQRYSQKATQDLREGQQNGITGTPGFLINGKIISGACPYSTFEQAINAELNGMDWSVTNCQVSIR